MAKQVHRNYLNITSNEQGVIVGRRDKVNDKGQKYTFYTVLLSNRDEEKKFSGFYIPLRFKKGISIPNGSVIRIDKAFISFYPDTKQPYVMVLKFENLSCEEGEAMVNDAFGGNEMEYI